MFLLRSVRDTAAYLRNRRVHPVGVVARLRPGAKLPQASAELELIGRQLTAQYPDSNKGRGFVAVPLSPDVGDVRSTLWLLLGAVGLVLLIACVNVASLLLLGPFREIANLPCAWRSERAAAGWSASA